MECTTSFTKVLANEIEYINYEVREYFILRISNIGSIVKKQWKNELKKQ